MKLNLITEQRVLLFSVFIVALCGIIYELILGSLATYLLGNPVQQYSITIGLFLSSMGLGSYLSRFIIKDLIRNFIIIEVSLGLVGGLSVIILNYLFSFTGYYYFLNTFFLVAIGTLVGLEIPLLTRILRSFGSLKNIISNVLTLDYIGGLAGSLLFPLLMFPLIGRLLTGLVIGIVNTAVALLVISQVSYTKKKKADFLYPAATIILLLILVLSSDQLNNLLQKKLFFDDIVFSKRTNYQEIILTRNRDDFRLFLDGAIQFSTFDEYRYHEMLVYPATFLNKSQNKNVLVLGGGDGLAVRDLLKCSTVNKIVLIELDPEMINLAKNNSTFKRINNRSLLNSKVTVIVDDAYHYLVNNRERFDVIIADFPDPHDEAISKLYTVEFFKLVKHSLSNNGIFVSQSTSPLFARKAFWCINNTMKTVFKNTIPYHIYIPTFGEWGFSLSAKNPISEDDIQKMNIDDIDFGFFSKETFLQSRHFPADCKAVATKINTLNLPVLYSYYLEGWKNVDL